MRIKKRRSRLPYEAAREGDEETHEGELLHYAESTMMSGEESFIHY